jgi:hypothetical protein
VSTNSYSDLSADMTFAGKLVMKYRTSSVALLVL